jgi:hypothetical protein
MGTEEADASVRIAPEHGGAEPDATTVLTGSVVIGVYFISRK